jgi:cytochrome c553
VVAHPRRVAGAVLFALGFTLFTVMTVISYYKDATGPVIKAQLARQNAEEAAFRAAPFVPLRTRTSESTIDEPATATDKAEESDGPRTSGQTSFTADGNAATPTTQKVVSPTSPPESFIAKCSGCHGTRGQGVKIYPRLIGVSAKPHRTVEDIIAIMNDPASYDLDPLMPSFAAKLSDDEKREIAEWTAALKKRQ